MFDPCRCIHADKNQRSDLKVEVAQKEMLEHLDQVSKLTCNHSDALAQTRNPFKSGHRKITGKNITLPFHLWG